MTERILGLEIPSRLQGRTGPLDRLLRNRLRKRFAAIREGTLTLIDGRDVERYGDPGARLRAAVFVEDPRFYRALALRGSLGGAEAFMDGAWRCDDLTSVVRILARNRDALAGLDGGAARLARPGLSLFHALNRNSRRGSRRNIAAHYDLGNEFFALFLDPTLTYSCGLFEREGASMEEASIAKYDRVCRKLGIGPRDHVLEIGTGWGGFALHAAARYGCRVTTTTISRRQFEVARQRVADARLGHRIEVLLEDYRDLRGRYDKLVSIEMIEAVGHRHLERFFEVCDQRLRPQGSMLLQAITVPDRDYEAHKRNVDFIKRYIFPGGELVSVGAAGAAAARNSELRLTHLEDIGLHYAETLRRWRRSMFDNISRMRALGLSDAFLRMWEFYLCYCEGGFEERQISAVQALFEKPRARRAAALGHPS